VSKCRGEVWIVLCSGFPFEDGGVDLFLGGEKMRFIEDENRVIRLRRQSLIGELLGSIEIRVSVGSSLQLRRWRAG
jgi:hypothetical protein